MEILPFISFFTGVASILSPCILPIIPIFVAFSLKTKSKVEILSFTAGLLSIFIVIIVLTGFFTQFTYSHLPYIRIVSAILLLIIGILMYTDRSISFKAITPKSGDGIVASFVLGFLTSVSWAPCYSGYLISLIALLVNSTTWYAVLNLTLYCLGFAVTLFVLSLAISRIDLENLISKTRYLPKIFAILIMFGAVYLIWESIKILI